MKSIKRNFSFTRLGLAALVGFLGIIISCSKSKDVVPQLDTPAITSDLSTVSFGSLDIDQESAAKTVNVTAVYLTGDVTASFSGDGFMASLSETSGFGTSITIPMASLDNGASVPVYVKATPTNGYQGSLAENLVFKSEGADSVSVALTATVALQITGELWLSEYFEEYTPDWKAALPLDSGILGWNMNTDTVMNQANAGGGYPETTVPNNQVMNTWYQTNPINVRSLGGTLGLSDASNLAITGYPAVSGARDILVDPTDAPTFWNWVKLNGTCAKPWAKGNNTQIARRFAPDGNTTNIFLSSLITVKALGSPNKPTTDSFGIGDMIFLANATTGPANNNDVKIVALTDSVGGFHFGLIKENEGNPNILSKQSYSFNTTYLVVMSHEFVPGDNNDVTKLYVFAEGDKIPTSVDGLTPVATIDASYNGGQGLDPTDLTVVAFRERQKETNAPTATFSGIRVGTSWVATLFQDHSKATVSNDLSLNNRVLSNEKSTQCN